MIKKKGKIILILLIFIIIFNFCSPISLAITGEDMMVPTNNGVIKPEGGLSDKVSSDWSNLFGSTLDFGAGILFYPIKLFIYIFAKAIHSITEAASGNGVDVTPETILFNKLDITNINFFDNSSGMAFSQKLKDNIASWYYVMRTIAIVASLCILLYIAIRMAISTVASEKAEYKRMLKDWLVGFALIFVLHYIIILVINGNNLIVKTLETTITETQTAENGQVTQKLEKYIDSVEKEIFSVDFTKSAGAIMVYVILVALTLAFLLMYIKRMIVVAFYIIISPLITITYAIDKVKDNKSQALDTWFKEFFWTIVIQPFHCVIYVVFVSIAFSSIEESSLSSSILAIMCMIFILQAEDIIKKIFGIQADNIGKMSSSVALAGGAALVASKFAKKGAGVAATKANNKLTSLANKAPQGNVNGTGVGTGPAENGNSLSQKAANLISSPAIQNKLNKFNNFMNDNKFGRAMKKTGNMAADYTKFSYKTGSALFGVGMAAPNAKGIDDLFTGALTGIAVGETGKRLAKFVGKKANIIERGRTQNAIDNVSNSYREMKRDKGLNDEEMREKVKALLDIDVNSSKLDDVSRRLAYNLQVLKHQLEKVGEGPNDNESTLDNIMSRIKLKDTDNQA